MNNNNPFYLVIFLAFTLVMACEKNAYMCDTGESFTCAKPIDLNTTILIEPVLDITPSYFSVEPEQEGVLHIEVEGIEKPARVCLMLYDSTGQLLEKLISFTDLEHPDFERLELRYRLEPRLYVLQLQASAIEADYYKVKTTFQALSATEPNNGFENAWPIGLGGAIAGTIEYPGDIDQYTFSLQQTDTLNFWVDPVPDGLRLRLSVFDELQVEQKRLYATEKGGSLALLSVGLMDGRYYIVISDADNSAASDSYVLRLQKEN